jgi:hypothetical protein
VRLVVEALSPWRAVLRVRACVSGGVYCQRRVGGRGGGGGGGRGGGGGGGGGGQGGGVTFALGLLRLDAAGLVLPETAGRVPLLVTVRVSAALEHSHHLIPIVLDLPVDRLVPAHAGPVLCAQVHQVQLGSGSYSFTPPHHCCLYCCSFLYL